MSDNLFSLKKITYNRRIIDGMLAVIIFCIFILIFCLVNNLFISGLLVCCFLIARGLLSNSFRNKLYIYQIDRTLNQINIKFLYKNDEKNIEIDVNNLEVVRDVLWYSYPIVYFVKFKIGEAESFRQYLCGEWTDSKFDELVSKF